MVADGTKRVVLVTQPYWPDLQSTSHLLTELLGAMAGDAVAFTVVCGHPTMLPPGAPRRSPARERRGNVLIHRCGLRLDYKRGLLRRAVYMASFVLGASWRIVRAGRGALVCAVTNPPFAPLWIRALSRLGGFRYQLICHDVFPDGLVALGKLDGEGALARIWESANRSALHGAERIVVLGRDMAELLRDRYGVPEDALALIPHWSINDGGGRYAPEQTALWKNCGFPEGSFVVQYSGNMGLWHDLESLVRAAALLKDDASIRFLLIGGGMRKAGAEALAAELGADNILWLPFRSEEELTDSLACCHLAIISQREGLAGVAVPCKLYGVLASGRGLLGMVPAESEVARVIGEEECGRRLDPDDAVSLAGVIREAARDRDTTRHWGARAYAAYLRSYRLEVAAAEYRRCWGIAD